MKSLSELESQVIEHEIGKLEDEIRYSILYDDSQTVWSPKSEFQKVVMGLELITAGYNFDFVPKGTDKNHNYDHFVIYLKGIEQ